MDPVHRDRLMLATVVGATLLAQVMLYPGLPDLLVALGISGTLAVSRWFLGVEFAAFIVFAGIWGAVSDAAERRVPFIAVGAAGGAAGYLLLAGYGPGLSFLAILLLRGLQGGMVVGALTVAMTTLMDLPGGHGRNMGAAGIAIGVGVAMGSPLGGQLTAIDPLGPLWAAGGVLTIAATMSMTVRDRTPASADRGPMAIVAGLRRTPTLTIPYAFGFVDRLTAGFFALVGTFYFREVYGLDAAGTGLTLALFFVPFALLQYPFGVISDRIGRRLPVIGGSMAYGVTVASVGLAGPLSVAQFGMVAVGVVGAFMAPATMALVTDIASSDQRGVAMAGFNIAGSFGFLVGVVGGGTIASSFGYIPAFLSVGLLEFVVAIIAVKPLLNVALPVDDRFWFG